MKRLMESGKIEEIIYVRLEPGEDILEALWDICVQKDVKTGVILEGSGAAVNFTYQHFPKNPLMNPMNVAIATMEGKCEISLRGTIGTTVTSLEDVSASPHSISNMFPTIKGVIETNRDKWNMIGSMNGHGSPYIHAHCTASNKDYTVCGHLMPGTKVASGATDKPSHFTVIIGKVSGVEFEAIIDDEIGFYHNVIKV